MSISAAEFSGGMRKLAASVTVITTVQDGVRYGLTASAVTSLSAAPPSLLACVNMAVGAHDPIRESGKFCVNILAQSQSAISNAFASARGQERFNFGQWEVGTTGLPRLIGCAASFECDLMDALPGFTHSVFVGLIRAVTLGPEDALLYAAGEYGHFKLPQI